MKISSQDKKFYNKLRVISSLNLPKKQKDKTIKQMLDTEVLDYCRYGHPSSFAFYRHTSRNYESQSQINKKIQISNSQKQFIKRISTVHEQKTGDNCLMAAIRTNNVSLTRFLIRNQSGITIDPNQTNKNNENAMMVNLKYNDDLKADKISSLLLKFINPKAKDCYGKKAYEIEQKIMTPSRARILQILRTMDKQRKDQYL